MIWFWILVALLVGANIGFWAGKRSAYRLIIDDFPHMEREIWHTLYGDGMI